MSKSIVEFILKLIMNLNFLYLLDIIFLFATLLCLASDLFFHCFILSFLSEEQTFFIVIKYFPMDFNLKKLQKIIDIFDNYFNFLNNSYLLQS
jgi:hypothetical protein